MSDNKKYYYLKLKDDFFDSDEIKILESMDNGYIYSNILLKMYLKSIKREGLLVFNERIPYNPKMIATVTNHNINDVKQALVLFQEMGMMEILSNGAIYMLDIQNYIGKSTTEADRIRAYRNKIEEKKDKLLSGDKVALSDVCTNVQQMNDKCTPEIEIEIDKEIDKDYNSNGDYSKIVQAFQNNGFGLINQGTKDILVDLIETYSSEWVLEALEISVMANVRKLNYAAGILKKWKAEGKDNNGKHKSDAPGSNRESEEVDWAEQAGIQSF